VVVVLRRGVVWLARPGAALAAAPAPAAARVDRSGRRIRAATVADGVGRFLLPLVRTLVLRS